jgi:AraC-like DNA-binding protein
MMSAVTSYDVRPPAPPLRPFISHYAGFCARNWPPGIQRAAPSRHAHLIISLGEPIDVMRMPNPSQCPGRFTALVGGLHDAPAIVCRGTSFEGIHVFVKPHGLRAILGIPGAELAAGVFDLSEFWPRATSGLIERLREAATWPGRFAILDEVFQRALTRVDRPPAIEWAWRQLEHSGGRRSIDGLAREIGWSRRYLSDCFRDEIGIGPKTAARIFRFERACRMIKTARPRLADVAAACGFFDQAHMTREWTALTGCSPRAWIASELPFLQDYELSDSDDAR